MDAKEFIISWASKNGINSMENILSWIEGKNEDLKVIIKKNLLSESDFWYLSSEGFIKTKNNSFFSVVGIKTYNEKEIDEQPIIIQDEIGYLGIICKKIDGVLHFLMQAKIEPGNVNKIQISPTIQATKSNFTQKHGGKKPSYLEYFTTGDKYEIIVDQIQSEQSSRFLKKRNRNIIIHVADDIEIIPSHKWMTLGQIKSLMRYNNIVNMDTRTVLSCIPYSTFNLKYDEIESYFLDKALCKSICEEKGDIVALYHFINDYKMFCDKKTSIVSLLDLKQWHVTDSEVFCEKDSNFKVVFCDISIEGREVKRWTQPLFEAVGIATFGLFTCVEEGCRYFLAHAKAEIGCFDMVELGPTVQFEAIEHEKGKIGSLFFEKIEEKTGIIKDVFLSEEGGRFYHEQNRNIIIEIGKEEIKELPKGYFWLSFNFLNRLTQINNIVNIQLRNLLSLLEVD